MIKGGIVVAALAVGLAVCLISVVASAGTGSAAASGRGPVDGPATLSDGSLTAQAATPAPKARKAATPAAKAPEAPNPAAGGVQGATAGWVTRCVTKKRDDAPDCAIEQSVVVAKTGQLVALLRIQVPSATRMPVMMVQLPLGLNLPAGVTLQVDDATKATFQIQTCDVQGCYVGSPIEPATIQALLAGKDLKMVFQNQDKQNVTVTLPLVNFAAGYDAIK